MSPTVPPTSTTMTSAWLSSASWYMRPLMASVTWGTDWMVPPRNSPSRSLAMTSEYIWPDVTLRGAGEADVDEPLVVAQVEVGLRAVRGDEDLAVLVRGHGPRIDVEVGV